MEESDRPAANAGAGERNGGNQDEALMGCRIGARAERKKDKSRKDQRIRERNYLQEVGILKFESAGGSAEFRTSWSVATNTPSTTIKHANRNPAIPKRRWMSTRPAETRQICVMNKRIQQEKTAP